MSKFFNHRSIFVVIIFITTFSYVTAQNKPQVYPHNRAPLKIVPYALLPIGAIKPKGILLKQLEIMRDGLTGHLDERYERVVGKRNAWLGGDGDGFERGPYWIDGLLPLAYILRDSVLIKKVQPWIEMDTHASTKKRIHRPHTIPDIATRRTRNSERTA